MLLSTGTPMALAQASDESRDREARALFEAAREAYGAAEYERALEYFQRAYELSGRPALLFNIAQSAERTRDDDRALASYELFIEADPDSEFREQAERRVSLLRAHAAEVAAAAEPGPSTEPAGQPSPEGAAQARESRGGTRGRGAAIALLGGGAAAATAGTVLLVLSQRSRSAVEDAPDGTVWSDVESD
ncbi:MAG: hypothetical protein H5U40_03485 [Polyangiaceae bacterium]|nr:hypothetical protein [Polyangiaceae bacterium]